jgi:Ty3 transposon capsid-like protein/Zinc knuckle
MSSESSSSNIGPEPTTMTMNFREIPINKPTPFTGDRTKIRGFLQQCLGYLQLNRPIYMTDEAKIAFVLSFLTDGEALKWRETYLLGLMDDKGEFQYPKFKEFLDIFTMYFKPINQIQTANNQLATLKQGKRNVEDYVAEFRLLVSMAGMTSDTSSDNIHLINYFRRGLNPAIARKIALSDNVPTTIVAWTERAIQYDTNYRLTMAMFGNPAGGRSNWKKERDPDAMDIDAMTADRRATLMKQGLCFKCEGRGHLARDCKGKKKDTAPPKKNIKDIHAMLLTLSADETKELLGMQKTDEKKDDEKKDDDQKDF